jgi:hypothetical protein
MKGKSNWGLVAAILCVPLLSTLCSGEKQEKKLIHFGWDMKRPAALAKEIEQLQDLPFDGLTISSNWCWPFYSTGLGSVDPTVEIAKTIKWGRFTDNLMYMTAGKKVDWFDDAVWADDGEILKNIRAVARIGAAAGCRGILFDPEFIYWGEPDGPWSYSKQKRHKEKTFAEFEIMVRKRGVQVIDTIEAHMPDTNFMSLFWGSMSSFIKAGAEAAKANDPKLYREFLEGEHYGLLSAFMCGILEGADPGTRVIDGNEHAYYNNHVKLYREQARIIREDTLRVIPDDLKDKYRRQVQVGHSVYADNLSNTFYQHSVSTYMTPAERARWMEHNVYCALTESDHIVWFYTERLHYLRHKGIAPEMIPAINRAREKAASGEPLGFNVDDICGRAWRDYLAAENGPVPKAEARVLKRKGEIAIDGNLDDAGWQGAAKLDAFQRFRTAISKLYGTSEGLITYDDQALYIAVNCSEPAGMVLPTKFNDDGHSFGKNDQVDFVVAADEPITKFYHIMLTTDGKTWDSLTIAADESYGADSSWTGDYQTAVKIAADKSRYTAEIALPWKTLGRSAPKVGDTLKGNVYRWGERNPDGFMELSSWSRSRRRRAVEAAQFGTWTFQDEVAVSNPANSSEAKP